MTTLSRRVILLTPVALIATRYVSAATAKMMLAMHQNTSAGAGYRKSLEGWSRAGSNTSNSPVRFWTSF